MPLSELVIATIIQMIVLKLKYGVIEKQQKIMVLAVVFLFTHCLFQ